jgi:peptidoglycan/LPS O-acetylase OafA/YrhL
LPALFTVLAATIPICAVLLSVPEVKANVWTALSAVGLGSNFKLMVDHGDYFAVTDTPYLHLWSLSMEEQFYLFFALLVWVTTRSSKRRSNQLLISRSAPMLLLVLAGASLAFSANVVGFSVSQEFLFFSPFSRVWQFALGMLVAGSHRLWNVKPPRISSTQRLVMSGVLLVLMTVLLTVEVSEYQTFDENFLSPRRVLVVASATIFLWASKSVDKFAMLSGGPLRWLGDRSYSVYLWHAPLFFFAVSVSATLVTQMLAVVVTLLLSELTFRKFEKPYLASSVQRGSAGFQLGISIVAIASCAGALLGTPLLPNLIQRFADRPIAGTEFTDRWLDFAGDKAYDGCMRVEMTFQCGEPSETVEVALIGDSHAMAISHAFLDAARAVGVNAIVRTTVSCSFFAQYESCPGMSEFINELMRHRTRIYVSACPRLPSCTPKPDPTLEELNRALDLRRQTLLGISLGEGRVTLLETLPFVEDTSAFRMSLFGVLTGRQMARNVGIDSRFDDYLRLVEEHDKDTADISGGALQLLSLRTEVCGENQCLGVTADGDPVWTNEDHLSLAGSRLLIGELSQAMSRT